MFFAFEDRQNICKFGTTPRIIWELIEGFMMDSVTKNIKVQHLVAEELGSDHIPPHYLCNAHTPEKFDEELLCFDIS